MAGLIVCKGQGHFNIKEALYFAHSGDRACRQLTPGLYTCSPKTTGALAKRVGLPTLELGLGCHSRKWRGSAPLIGFSTPFLLFNAFLKASTVH